MNPEILAKLEPLSPDVRASLLALEAQYDIESAPGKGQTGCLVFGRDKITGRKVAIKHCDWSGDGRYAAEPAILAGVRSPNIIEVYGAGFAGKDAVFFITPFCERGDLDDYMLAERPGLRKALHLASGVLQGVTELHAKRLVHRDLKPQNILVSDAGDAIVGDFGSVKKMPVDDETVPGSGHAPLYRPPESWATARYGTAGDVYQCGLTLFQLLGGRLPYEETAWLTPKQLSEYQRLDTATDRCIYASEKLGERIKRGKLMNFETIPCWIPEAAKTLVRKACRVTPDERFASAVEFRVKLHQLLQSAPDWAEEAGIPTLRGSTSYRIVPTKKAGAFSVEKRRNGDWRRESSCGVGGIADMVAAVVKATRTP